MFDIWKRLDDRLYRAGKKHVFELLGIRVAAQAADLMRRVFTATGIDRIDDLLEDTIAGDFVDRLIARLARPA